ncbi:MAG: hypothetical protein KC549_09625 [Myxococcales bacterium]|nr:hypothetical protein [Myxococcales bacterium]MCB9548593.1 hypothetical protein [Myxococcales bacterium]
MEKPQKTGSSMGLMGMFGVLMGAGCFLFAGLGFLNTAFDWELVLRISGARVEIPDSYDVCYGLLAAGAVFIGLTFFGGAVKRKFKEAKGRPMTRVLILLGAAGLLAAIFRAVQIIALVNTYGSMLAYYATDGDLEDVKKELAKGATAEDLDRAVGRAAQYDNHEALALLLAAGADFTQKTRPEGERRCMLAGTGPAFIKLALAHGVTPATCPDSADLLWYVVREGKDDAALAEVVTLLRGAGWTPVAPEYAGKQSVAGLAKQHNLPLTAAALTAP